jgi:hypothetical protein
MTCWEVRAAAVAAVVGEVAAQAAVEKLAAG